MPSLIWKYFCSHGIVSRAGEAYSAKAKGQNQEFWVMLQAIFFRTQRGPETCLPRISDFKPGDESLGGLANDWN